MLTRIVGAVVGNLADIDSIAQDAGIIRGASE